MKKLIEKNAQANNVESIIQKNKKYDKYHKNQNIILKKKNIIDISIFKIQKKQKYVFSHDAQISR